MLVGHRLVNREWRGALGCSRAPCRPGATDVDLRARHVRLVAREGGRRRALPVDARREPRPELGAGASSPRGRPARRAAARPRLSDRGARRPRPGRQGSCARRGGCGGASREASAMSCMRTGSRRRSSRRSPRVATRTPVVWVKHDFSYDGRLARLSPAGCRGGDRRQRGRDRYLQPATCAARSGVVHNGIAPAAVDREAGRSRLLEALGPPAPAAVVALVARLDPVKGHRELLAVAPVAGRGRARRCGSHSSAGTSPPHPDYPDELRRRGRRGRAGGDRGVPRPSRRRGGADGRR